MFLHQNLTTSYSLNQLQDKVTKHSNGLGP